MVQILLLYLYQQTNKNIMAKFTSFSIIVKDITEFESVSKELNKLGFINDERWNNRRKVLMNSVEFLNKRFYVEVNGDMFTLFSQSLSADDIFHFENLDAFKKSELIKTFS